MLYNLSSEIDLSRFNMRVSEVVKKRCLCELTEKKPITLSQNNYLHLILSYFALTIGENLDYVKRTYFKIHCNSDIFVREKEDSILHKTIKYVRSTSDLDTQESTLAIDRFRTFSSTEAGIYLPEPNEDRFLNEIRVEIEKNKQYL